MLSPTLSGLQDIDANGINTDNLIVKNITITGTGVAITQPTNDNSTKIATTAYVHQNNEETNVLNSNNTFLGTNYFSNAITSITQALNNNTTLLATTAFVQTALSNLLTTANIWTNSNTFSGNTTAVTQVQTDNSTKVATTAYCKSLTNNLLTSTNTWTGGSNSFLNPVIFTNSILGGVGGVNDIFKNKTSGTITIGGSTTGTTAIQLGSGFANNAITITGAIWLAGGTYGILIDTPFLNSRGNIAGVYFLNGNYVTPLFFSCTDIDNAYNQQYTSGTTNYTSQSGGAVGSWATLALNDSNNRFVVLPRYGLIGYQNNSYGGSVYINFKNNTNNPVIVSPSNTDDISSMKIYYNGQEQLNR